MPFEPVFENLNYRGRCGETVNNIKIDCRTEVPSDTVRKIVNVEGSCGVYCGEKSEGKAEFFGRINFFVLYETVEGELKKCEGGAEFKDVAENSAITGTSVVRFSCGVEKTDISTSGVNLSISAVVSVKGKIFVNSEVRAISGGEGIIADVKERHILKTYSAAEISYPVDEEFEVNYKVAEVIGHGAKAVITAVQCGVGAIICDGEIYLTEIFLQSGEKKDIIREDRTIPFRIEAECEEAMPALSATARVNVKTVKTDVAVDEEGGVSTVSVAVTLDVGGEAESLESVNVAADAFSTECELELKKEKAAFFAGDGLKTVTLKAEGRCAVEELPQTAKLLGVLGERADIISVEKTGASAVVSGTVSVTAVFSDGEDDIVVRKVEFPFEKNIDMEKEFDEIEISVVAERAHGKIFTFTELDVDTDLVFTASVSKYYEFPYLSQVTEGEKKFPEQAAVSVYIPLVGEGLWDLSKRLNVSPEKLIATNTDLQFPLSGKERIVVYRQK